MLLKWSILGLCTCWSLYLEHPVPCSQHHPSTHSFLSTERPPWAAFPAAQDWVWPFFHGSSQPHSSSHHIANTSMYTTTLHCKLLFLWIFSLYSGFSWVSGFVLLNSHHHHPLNTANNLTKTEITGVRYPGFNYISILAEWSWPINS